MRQPRKTTKHFAVLATLLIMALAVVGFTKRRRAGESHSLEAGDVPRPNILLIVVDALRADRLGCYGHNRALSPTMDTIAAEGVVFDQAVAPAPWTQPSVAALFTGMHPGAILPVEEFRLSFDSVRRGAEPIRVLDDRYTTLAAALRAQGYSTAAIVTNPFVDRDFGFAQGFEHFDAVLSTATPGNEVNYAGCTWLEQRDPEKPFFLLLYYMDVHGPYDAKPEFLEPLLDSIEQEPVLHRLTPNQVAQLDPRYLYKLPKVYVNEARHLRLMPFREYWVARYEAGVAELDHHLVDLRERLTRMELWDDLAVVVTADHGEALGENTTFAHGLSVHHVELHIPLIMRWPRALPAGRHVSDTVRLLDVMPTILDQLDMPPVAGVHGTSLLPYITGDVLAEPPVLIVEGLKVPARQVAFYRGDWKLVRLFDPPAQALYHFSQDPFERRNLARQYPQMLELLVGLETEQRNENDWLAADAQRERIELDQERLRQLRSLGYLR